MSSAYLEGIVGTLTAKIKQTEDVLKFGQALPGAKYAIIFAYKRQVWSQQAPYLPPEEQEGLMVYNSNSTNMDFIEPPLEEPEAKSHEERFREDARQIRSLLPRDATIKLYSGPPIEATTTEGYIFRLKAPSFSLEDLAYKLRTCYTPMPKTQEPNQK